MPSFRFTLILVPLIFPLLCIAFSLLGLKSYENFLIKEDGLLETCSFFIWIGLAVVFSGYGLALKKSTFKLCVYFFIALCAFFIAMEEISWGQRVFDIQTPEVMQEMNLQNETNLHNLKVGNIRINRILTRVGALVIITYFLIFPWLYQRGNKFVVGLIDYFKIPLIELKHAWVIALYALISDLLVTHERHGELMEFYAPFLILVLFVGGYQSVKNTTA